MAKLVGLTIKCSTAGTVTVARNDFIIGKRSEWPDMQYNVKCPCGLTHRIPVKQPSMRIINKVLQQPSEGKGGGE